MKLKNSNKLKGDWNNPKINIKDKIKFEEMDDEITVDIFNEDGSIKYNKHIILSVEPVYDDLGNVRGFKSFGKFVKV